MLAILAGWMLLQGIMLAGSEKFQMTLEEDGDVKIISPDGAEAVYQPIFVTLYAEKDPNIAIRFGRFQDKGLQNGSAGSTYHVITWGNVSEAVKSSEHVADGFNPDEDRGYGADRTANLFQAGRLTTMRAESAYEKNGRITWVFPSNEAVDLNVEIDIPEDGSAPRMNMLVKVKRAGWWSFGYVGAPALALDDVHEVWQPLIYTDKRFPEDSFIEGAYRCSLPTTLVSSNKGVTVGVMADPKEFPFETTLPTLLNSRFGVALRNQKGLAQPMIFAPMLGAEGSNIREGESFGFTSRLVVTTKSINRTFENLARTMFGFADIRHNVLGSLNTAFDNLLSFGLSEYAKFNKELRGFSYDTDVPGSVKNVSALHPLSLALVTDSREIYEELVYPQVEYFISRDRFLFTIRPNVRGQGVSKRLGGNGAPLSEYATLYTMTGKRTPYLLSIAESLFPLTRSINLDSTLRGEFWANSLALYRASGDKKWLDRAIHDADDYLKTRVLTPTTTFDDPDSRGLFFWTSYAPQWMELYELYEETGYQRYLDAAWAGARTFTQFTWMAPKIPDGCITANEGGLAPAYRKGPKYTTIHIPEEKVPAWQVSEMGLTSESSVTSRGHRGILFATYAPWMLRIAEKTGDKFLHDIARSAVIGRYTSFPGYHMNTARTTVYQKPNFAERAKDELNSTTSIHYNHIWPFISMVFDYLVADTFEKSQGAVFFPGRYAEGYAYLQQKIYGDRPGKVFDYDNMYLWMPRRVIEVTHPELNYITARGDDSFAVVLTNQCKKKLSAQIRLNDLLIKWPKNTKDVKVELIDASGTRSSGVLSTSGSVGVEVAPEGLTAVVFQGVAPKVEFQREMVGGEGPKLPEKGSFLEMDYRGARAVALLLGPREPARVYTYIPDFDREIAECTLHYRQGTADYTAVKDDSFPFEYTIPTSGLEAVEFYFDIKLKNGNQEKSPHGKILLK